MGRPAGCTTSVGSDWREIVRVLQIVDIVLDLIYFLQIEGGSLDALSLSSNRID